MLVEPRHERLQIGAADDGDVPSVPAGIDDGPRRDDRLALGERRRLRHDGVSLIRTVSLPCVMATMEICTSWPITTVPVRSSMTTRAGLSGLDRNFADLGEEARRGDLRRA